MSVDDSRRSVPPSGTASSGTHDNGPGDAGSGNAGFGNGAEAYERLRHDEDIPPIDFTTIVLSLSTSALMQMGEVPEELRGHLPEGQQVDMDLAMARQTIDMLGILEEKTRGNLSGEEERLLSQVLFDVRVRYVAKAKRT